jgi:CubicO group peptidase (beta-lactamase class C family)
MMMVEQGKLKLDDDVSTYLPAFKSMQVLTSHDEKAGTYETKPNTKPITIRQLLTHTSGIGYSWSDPGLALVQRKTNKGGETDLPLVHAPGEKWTYGASTKVLGDVVEKLSGERIDAFTDRHIAKPLGMNDTFYEVPKSEVRARGDHAQQGRGRQDHRDAEPGHDSRVAARRRRALFHRAGLRQVPADAAQRRAAGERAHPQGVHRGRHAQAAHQRRARAAAAGRRGWLSKPYPLGAGEDIWGLGFQLADPKKADPACGARQRQLGRHLQHVLLDRPEGRLGVVVMMQMLPFYDADALATLQGVERRVYSNLK